jgi:hypothetical protein
VSKVEVHDGRSSCHAADIPVDYRYVPVPVPVRYLLVLYPPGTGREGRTTGSNLISPGIRASGLSTPNLVSSRGYCTSPRGPRDDDEACGSAEDLDGTRDVPLL